jgi:hypothetical protein
LTYSDTIIISRTEPPLGTLFVCIIQVTAFRQLVSERWRHDGERPNTRILREILYGQITGFDINESALRFAALGLYLASIELDPDPEPVQKLRFENLRGAVLHYLRGG